MVFGLWRASDPAYVRLWDEAVGRQGHFEVICLC